MKRWITLWYAIIMGLAGVAHASQKPLKQASVLQTDKPVTISASMVEEVYTKGMVLHAKDRTQLWFDDRITRQKHWGSMWVWPIKPGQTLCVRALNLSQDKDLQLHPFLEHPGLAWPSNISTQEPVCFKYPTVASKADVKPDTKPKKTKKSVKPSEEEQPTLSPIEQAIRMHWIVEDRTAIEARQKSIFDKIPTAGDPWFKKKHKITRQASIPSDLSLRWVVLHYPTDSPHQNLLADKVWQLTYKHQNTTTKEVTLPIGLSMGMWLGALWHVYGDVPHQWLNVAQSGDKPTYGTKTGHAIKYNRSASDDGGAFIDRAFIGTRSLERRVFVSDLSWRAIDKKVKKSKRFGAWSSMKQGGVWGRFYVMPSLSHLKCVSTNPYGFRRQKVKHHCQTYLTPGSYLTTTSNYRLEFAQNSPVMYERGFMMTSSDFHAPPELKWLPRKHLGVGKAPKVNKPKSKKRTLGCQTVPIYPGEIGLYLTTFVVLLVIRRQRRRWQLVGVLMLILFLVSNVALARKRPRIRTPKQVSRSLNTPFAPMIEVKSNKQHDPRCRRYVNLNMDGKTHKLSTWELLCVPFGKPLDKIYTQVLALPPSRYAMDTEKLPTTSKRAYVTSLKATMESPAEVDWSKFVGKRLPTSFTYRLKDYRLFIPQRGASACSFARRMKQKDVLLKLKKYESLCKRGWHIVVATYERYRRNLGVQDQRGGSFVILPGLDVEMRFDQASSSLDISPDSVVGSSKPSDAVIHSQVMLSADVFEPCFRIEKTYAKFRPSAERNAYKRVEMEYHLTSKPCDATSRGFALSPRSR